MSSPYICITCRRTISHLRRNKSFQWHSKAAFNSLIGTSQTSAKDQHERDERDEADSTRGFRVSETRDNRSLPPVTRHATKEPVDALESMFEDTLKRQSNVQPSSYRASFPQQTSCSVIALEHAEKLQKMLRGRHPIGDCWAFFVEHFGPTAWNNGTVSRTSWPATLKSEVPILVGLIREKRKEMPLRDDLPPFSEVIRITFELGLLRGAQWTRIIIILLQHIQDVGVTTVEGLQLVIELLKSWNIVCRKRRYQMEGKKKPVPEIISSASDWSNLPVHSMRSVYIEQTNYGIQGAFGLLTAQFSRGQTFQVPLLALGTLSILLELERSGISPHIVRNAQPFMSQISALINICEMSLIDTAQFFRFLPESLFNLVKDNWSNIKGFADEQKQKLNLPKTFDFKVHENERSQSLHKKVGEAFSRRDVSELDQLWLHAQKLPFYIPTADDGSDIGYRPNHLTPAFCNYFILCFMGLKQQPRAIDVWNHMIQKDITPDLGAWDALLNGAKIARDPEALEHVWAMMMASGTVPDVTCWTTRISGLIHCYKTEEGIRALDEMSRLWLAAVQRKHPHFTVENAKKTHASKFENVLGAVRPTIATVNATVSGLIKRQDGKAATRVLAWADSWGIIPDVQTFNSILSQIVRAGHVDKTPELLKAMEARGIQADAATFITIVEQSFADIDALTPEEQIEATNNIFQVMEGMKITPNLMLYGKIIHLLLKNVPVDTRPVSEVTARMAAQNLTPSTYIYTIFLDYYFALSPPNFNSINTLIERVNQTVGSVDHIFWDRLIEGYARVGETSSAMFYLGKIQKSKQFTSWHTMRTLLMALVENDEWELARELVDNVGVDTGGPIDEEAKGVEGQHKFWALARQLELVG